MKLIIEIDENMYYRLKNMPLVSSVNNACLKAVANGKPLPKGATNGEVIESLFPNVGTIFANVIDLNLWWNAKYKAESEA